MPTYILDMYLHANGFGHAHTHARTRTGAAGAVCLGYRDSAVIAIIFYSLELCLRRRESAGAEASNFGGGGGFALVFKASWQSAGLRWR